MKSCQDVSAAGKRAGIKDGTRSGLWAVFAEAIDQLRPPIVVIENVRGLLSAAAHRTETNEQSDHLEPDETTLGNGAGRPVLRAAGAVLGDLADLGYDAQWATVAASDVGAPHRRERVFIVATTTDSAGGTGNGLQQQDLPAGIRRQGKSRVSDCGSSSCGGDAPHSSRNGWDEGRPESAGIVGGSDAAVGGHGDGVGESSSTANADRLLCERGSTSEQLFSAANSATRWSPSQSKHLLLPTPQAADGIGGKTSDPDTRRANGHSVNLSEVAINRLGVGALLPTPCVVDRLATTDMTLEQWDESRRSQKERGVGSFGPRGDSLGAAVLRVEEGTVDDRPDYSSTTAKAVGALLPTPLSRDGKGRSFDADDESRLVNVIVKLPTDLTGPLRAQGKADSTGKPPESGPVSLLPTPAAADGQRGQDFARAGREGSGGDDLVTLVVKADNGQQWGKYEPAIRRWEALTRPAPAPTEPNKNGNPRLSAAFSEWLMGWPAGWVTDPAIGISRNDQLRIVGNGVCPQQAVAALRFLLSWR